MTTQTVQRLASMPRLARAFRSAALVLTLTCLAQPIGCQSRTAFTLGDPPPGAASTPALPKMPVPCALKVICPNQLTGQRHSSMPGARPDIYEYPLRAVLEKAMSDRLYSSFDKPRAQTLNAFSLEVEVFQSRLSIRGNTVTYFLKTHVMLRSPQGNAIATEEIESQRMGGLCGNQLPDAVWESVYEVATQAVEKIVNNPRTQVAVQSYAR